MMQVAEVMSREVERVSPQTSLVDAARIMRDTDVGALPVGEEDSLIGMVTDRDIVIDAIAQGVVAVRTRPHYQSAIGIEIIDIQPWRALRPAVDQQLRAAGR